MSLVFLCGHLAAVGQAGILERSPVHLRVQHTQSPGQVEIEP